MGRETATWRVIATLDLSAVGIRFESEELYDASDPVEILLHLPSYRKPLVLSGRVVRSRPLLSGVVECAVEFLEVTPTQQEDLDGLVQFLKQPPKPRPSP